MDILPTRPLYRRLLFGGLLLILLLGGAAGWMTFRHGSLQSRIDAIRAAGDPATIADLAPKWVPADEDAAAQLAPMAGRLDAFSRELHRFEKSPLGLDYGEREDRGEGPTAEQLDAVRAIADKYPDVAEAIQRAAACPRYASRLDYRLPQPQFIEALHQGATNIRGVARFVAWQMKFLVAEGRPDAALELGIELLQLTTLYDDAEPGLVNGQMANAVRNLAVEEIYKALAADQGSITPALRQELDRELAGFDVAEVLRRSIKKERACVISATLDQLGGMKAIVVNTVGMPIKIMYLESIDALEPMLALVDQPWYVTFERGKPNIFEPTAGSGVMASLLAPSFKAQFDMVHRTSAKLQALRIVNALQQYADEHGKEAGGLADLNLPAEAIEDPFTGQPLRAERTERGWVVYSVGADGADGGGDFTNDSDVGVGPAETEDAEGTVDDKQEKDDGEAENEAK